MKKAEVEIGRCYIAKVSGKLARVRIERESPYGGWDAKNLDTGRRVRIRSAARLRRPAKEPHPERDYTTLAEFFPVSMGRPGTAAHQNDAHAPTPSEIVEARKVAQAEGTVVAGDPPPQNIDERIAAAPASIVPYEQRRARAEAAQAAAEQNEDAVGDPDLCATVGCGRPSALTYLGLPLCQRCYEDQVADGDLPDRQAGETTQTPNHEETNMATKTTKPSKKRATKTVKASKAATQPKATKPKAPKPASDLPAPAKAGRQAGAKPKRLSALDAAAQVLAQAGRPMRAQELIAAMAEQGLWTSPAGKTPHATLYAAMLREARDKGDQARFRKADRGLFEYAG